MGRKKKNKIALKEDIDEERHDKLEEMHDVEENHDELEKHHGKSKEKHNKLKRKEKKLILIFGSLCIICLIALLVVFFFVPTIKLNGKDSVKVEVFENYQDEGATASLGGRNYNKIKVSGKVDTTKLGTYQIDYEVKVGPFRVKTTRKVKVVDEENPIITLTDTKKQVLCPLEEYVEDGYQATDNYDGDITDKVEVTETTEKTKVIYEVKDSSGNTTKAVRDIIRKDETSPTITLSGGNETYIELGKKYSDYGYVAKDNCDGDLTSKVVVSGTVDTAKEGVYEITYQVADSNQNKAVVKRKVHVVKAISMQPAIKGTIYLTFDDGPSASITPSILSILEKKGVKATFFVINHDNSLNYLIKKEKDSGHTVAIHSYTHNYSYVYQSEANYFSDLEKMQNKIETIIGEKVMILRFPGGSSNTVSRSYKKGIMTILTQQVKARGYHYFDWNVDSNDAGSAKNATDVYNNVVNNLSKSRSNVVLMHDFENNTKTLNALEKIIDYGLTHGYEFRAIDMSTAMVTHNVNN